MTYLFRFTFKGNEINRVKFLTSDDITPYEIYNRHVAEFPNYFSYILELSPDRVFAICSFNHALEDIWILS